MKKYFLFILLCFLVLNGCSEKNDTVITGDNLSSSNLKVSEEIADKISKKYASETIDKLYGLKMDPDFSGQEYFLITSENDNKEEITFRVLAEHKKELLVLFELEADQKEFSPYKLAGFMPYTAENTYFAVLEKKTNPNSEITFFAIGKTASSSNIEMVVDNEFYDPIPVPNGKVKIEADNITISSESDSSKSMKVIFNERGHNIY